MITVVTTMQNDEFFYMPPLESVHESNHLDLHKGDLHIPNNSNILVEKSHTKSDALPW